MSAASEPPESHQWSEDSEEETDEDNSHLHETNGGVTKQQTVQRDEYSALQVQHDLLAEQVSSLTQQIHNLDLRTQSDAYSETPENIRSLYAYCQTLERLIHNTHRDRVHERIEALEELLGDITAHCNCGHERVDVAPNSVGVASQDVAHWL